MKALAQASCEPRNRDKLGSYFVSHAGPQIAHGARVDDLEPTKCLRRDRQAAFLKKVELRATRPGRDTRRAPAE